jgi:hypothetical protein
MFLSPGAAEDDALFAARDIEVYDNIVVRKNDSGYNYFVIHKDLYTVWRRKSIFCPLTREYLL